MKKLVGTLLLLLLLVTLATPVHASVTIQATIDRSINVVFILENINLIIYNEIKQTFNVTTIPVAIIKNLKQQNLTRARWGYIQDVTFNDTAHSIRSEFYLAGSDIINFKFNKTTTARIYHVQTQWRKFHVNLTDNFSLGFAEYFDTPVANWNYNDSEKACYYEHTEPDLTVSSCKFVLPPTATNVQRTEDTIIFEVPPLLGDVLLNSPFLILGALIVVVMFAFIYRRLRK